VDKIRVIAADDHDIVRDGLRELINKQPDMTMVAIAQDGEEALEKARALHPDIMLVDIAMPGINGLGVINLIKEISPTTRVVVFSMYKRDAYVHQALTSGALGYVLKTSPTSVILDAIRTVHQGEYFLSHSVETGFIESYIKQCKKKSSTTAYDRLSEREQGVFRLMAEGRSIKEMANLLILSPKTIEKHRSNVMRKLGLSTVMATMKYAVKIGVIDPDLWED
jgi:two-component system response regulator NreC